MIVSRGELVEIGDGFRIPDILAESGARLVEVGTTNRTYLRDFERAWSERTRAVLRVHSSNYRIVGFTAQPALEELVRLGQSAAPGHRRSRQRRSGRPALLPTSPARESLRLGVDIVTFSGDKLLGGPQAGVVLGTREAIARLRGHPLARAVASTSSTWRRSTRCCASTSTRWGGRARADAGAARPVERRIRERAARLCAADRRRRARRLGRPRRRGSAAGRRAGERRRRSRRGSTATPVSSPPGCAAARRRWSATFTASGCCSTC